MLLNLTKIKLKVVVFGDSILFAWRDIFAVNVLFCASFLKLPLTRQKQQNIFYLRILHINKSTKQSTLLLITARDLYFSLDFALVARDEECGLEYLQQVITF